MEAALIAFVIIAVLLVGAWVIAYLRWRQNHPEPEPDHDIQALTGVVRPPERAPRSCPNCGMPLNGDITFCGFCGTAL